LVCLYSLWVVGAVDRIVFTVPEATMESEGV
jgi:hypothetical protein